MRIFLDANILFSAAKSDGALRELLRLLLAAGHECRVDDYVIIEARRNLHAKGPEALALFEALLLHMKAGHGHAHCKHFKEIDWLPEKDRPVLAAAIHSPRSLAETIFT